jgi:hypothetical protein
MKLLSVTPQHGGSELARVSVEIAEGVSLHDVKVMRTGCVFARNATLGREVRTQIVNLVKGYGQHDCVS